MEITNESVYHKDTPGHKKKHFFSVLGSFLLLLRLCGLFEGPSAGPKPALFIGSSTPTVNGSVSLDYNGVK